MQGTSNLSIGISLILRDQFSGGMASARRELDSTTAAAQRTERASIESQRNMAAAGAAAGIVALSAMKQWVDVGANFDKQMTYSYSIMDDKGGKSLRTLKDRAIEVGQDTMFSTTQVAEAITTMAQAGQTGEQVFNNINSTAVLAAASMSDIQSAASSMNDIMIGFDITATEKNSMHVADVITQSINQSNIHLKDFQESMKYIIPTATSLGISLEEVAAMISVVGNAGIKGSMAGTNVENMMRYLAKATGANGKGKQADALRALGLTEQDLMQANGQLKTMPELIQLIGVQLTKMEGTSGFNAMMDIFGVRGGRAANLLAKNMAGYDKFLGGINNSGGTAQRTANDVMGTLWGGMERLESTWESFKISFTEAIMPVLVPALTAVTAVLQMVVSFMKQPIGKFITIAAAGFILLRTGALTYRAIVLTLRLLHMQLGSTMATSTTRGVSGYNTLTSSINRATMAAERLNAVQRMGVGGMGTAMYNPGRKQWTSNNWGIGKDKAVMQRWNQRFGGRARIGNILSKGSMPAMLGGMALTGASSMAEEGSTEQKGMQLGGSLLSGAGTGAMIGSAIPGIGTAVGAIVGGVGATLWTLYDMQQAELEKVKQAEAEAKALKGESVTFQAHDWAKRAKAIITMRSQAYAFTGNFAPGQENATAYQDTYGTPGGGLYGKQNKITTQNKIVVNIDGTEAFNRTVEDNDYSTNVQFSF